MPLVRQVNRILIKRQGPLPWAIGLGIFVGSLAVRTLLARALKGQAFMTFYPAIAAGSLICGWQEGVAILALSAFSAWYLFIEPISSYQTIDALVGFLFAGGFIVFVVAALRESLRRLELAKAVQDTLFGELQHRVANNLQLVVALLRNAQRSLRNPVVAAETLNEAEDRILAMVQLHRRLNDGTAYEKGLEPLLREMIANAFRGLPVTVHVNVRDASDLTIDQMTAVTLLVNEAAINAAKPVFSKGLGRRFDVSLGSNGGGRLTLNISDDGPGMAAQWKEHETRSLGMAIMEAFATQLGGSLEVGRSGGAALTVDFKTRYDE